MQNPFEVFAELFSKSDRSPFTGVLQSAIYSVHKGDITMWNAKLCIATMGLAPTVPEEIELFKAAGFDGFFSGWGKGADIAGWRKKADELGMLYQSIHAPFLKAAHMWTTGEKADIAVAELKDCLAACADNGVPLMIAHAFIGFEDHNPTEAGLVNFEKVVKEAERLGVKIALENTEGEEYLAALMDYFKGCDTVGFCFDSGHEMCYNHSKDMLGLYGDRLLGTHLNDNLGIRDFGGKTFWHDDLHLLPFDGIGDWKNVAHRLNRCGFSGPLTFELTRSSKPNRHENDAYGKMTAEEYLTQAYMRACRIAALKNFEA